MNVIDAGSYTITTGIYRGNEHVFVTHKESGKQWIEKTPYDARSLEFLAEGVRAGVHRFDHTRGIGNCDTRFWLPVTDAPAMPRSEFDALVFLGD